MADPVRAADVEALVAQFEASGCAELHVRLDGFELHLSNDAMAGSSRRAEAAPRIERASPAASPASPAPAPPAAGAPGADDLEGFAIVRAPYLGTFYRAPKPGAPVYVEIGDTIAVGGDLCLVEVMKLFTAVRAEVAGTVARVLATDGAMVEAGQPLFAIRVEG